MPVGFVEEDDVEFDRVHIGDIAELGDDLGLVFAFFGLDKVEETFAEFFDLFEGGAEFADDGDCLCGGLVMGYHPGRG